MALIVAAPDPEIPAKIMFAITETIPRPPFVHEITERQKSRISFERFAAPIISPARIKRGPAIRAKEFIPRIICCTAINPGKLLPKRMARSPPSPIAKLTGTPNARKTNRPTIAIVSIYLSPLRYCRVNWGIALA